MGEGGWVRVGVYDAINEVTGDAYYLMLYTRRWWCCY